MQDDYSGSATDKPTKKMEYYSNFMRPIVALCEHVTLPFYTQVWVNVMTKIYGRIHTKPKNSLWTERRVRASNGIHELVANTPSEILLTI